MSDADATLALPKRDRLTLRLEPELRLRLDTLAAERGLSVSDLIRQLVVVALDAPTPPGGAPPDDDRGIPLAERELAQSSALHEASARALARIEQAVAALSERARTGEQFSRLAYWHAFSARSWVSSMWTSPPDSAGLERVYRATEARIEEQFNAEMEEVRRRLGRSSAPLACTPSDIAAGGGAHNGGRGRSS
jgi:hypothetical protein